MDASNWEFLQSFTPQFQAMRSDLESRIEAAKALPSTTPEVLNELSALLAKAGKALADAAGAIPTYDQKQYESQLKALEKSIEILRAANVPKSKFAFKRKAPTPSTNKAPSTTSSAPTPAPAPAPEAPVEPATSTSSHLVLSSHSHKYLTVSDLGAHPLQTDLAISDLENCVVDLLPPKDTDASGAQDQLRISALHVRNLTNCVLLLPAVEGSALLHDMSRCIIVLGSHQFRMHSSTKIDVMLAISSNPIIEDCSAIRFAQYPARFQAPPKPLPMFSVQDFSHIRPTPSPHYSIMASDETARVEQALVSTRANSTTIISTLSSILPQ